MCLGGTACAADFMQLHATYRHFLSACGTPRAACTADRPYAPSARHLGALLPADPLTQTPSPHHAAPQPTRPDTPRHTARRARPRPRASRRPTRPHCGAQTRRGARGCPSGAGCPPTAAPRASPPARARTRQSWSRARAPRARRTPGAARARGTRTPPRAAACARAGSSCRCSCRKPAGRVRRGWLGCARARTLHSRPESAAMPSTVPPSPVARAQAPHHAAKTPTQPCAARPCTSTKSMSANGTSGSGRRCVTACTVGNARLKRA
jgi:hypothetical protein